MFVTSLAFKWASLSASTDSGRLSTSLLLSGSFFSLVSSYPSFDPICHQCTCTQTPRRAPNTEIWRCDRLPLDRRR